MSDNLYFIVFAVKQAKETEEYGFTRNECCRNFKTALHQYWQNKTTADALLNLNNFSVFRMNFLGFMRSYSNTKLELWSWD